MHAVAHFNSLGGRDKRGQCSISIRQASCFCKGERWPHASALDLDCVYLAAGWGNILESLELNAFFYPVHKTINVYEKLTSLVSARLVHRFNILDGVNEHSSHF